VPGLLREGRVTANGLRFAYLEGGSGPLVVLLHGWPDTPHTWDHQLAALAGAGFRVAASWLRGYPPTEIPRSGYFDIGTLALDVRELIRVLGGGDPCLLVGQDWGASIGYQVLAAFPEVVRSAVVMAVPSRTILAAICWHCCSVRPGTSTVTATAIAGFFLCGTGIGGPAQPGGRSATGRHPERQDLRS